MSGDFSSSLYLGFEHSSRELDGWEKLTTGFPAAYSEPISASRLGHAVARLQGLEDGVVAPSSLHLFWDWFGRLDAQRHQVFFDAQLYQVGRWGVERAKGLGVETIGFRHQCSSSLQKALWKNLKPGFRPVIVTDGWCPVCGKAAPLSAYLKQIDALNGLLVLDDTQALGILGKQPNAENPYGLGGGGLLQFLGLSSKHIVSISSLAKAFGVPIAVLSGSGSQISSFKYNSETRVFASPPSNAHITAGLRALDLNVRHGGALRSRLLEQVRVFKSSMQAYGLSPEGGLFPVQSVAFKAENQTRQWAQKLAKIGIKTVLAADHALKPRVCWILNALHHPAGVRWATHAAVELLKPSNKLNLHQKFKNHAISSRRNPQQ